MKPGADTRFEFTEAAIRALPSPPTGKAIRYRDEYQEGLYLRVTYRGTKTFSLYRNINKKIVEVKLGRHPALTVMAARVAAQEKLKEMTGADPAPWAVAVGPEPEADAPEGDGWELDGAAPALGITRAAEPASHKRDSGRDARMRLSALAMQGFLASTDRNGTPQEIAAFSLKCADALIAELAK